MQEETQVYYGGAVKALGDGKVGGYLVRFTGPDAPDIEGEYFTDGTYYGTTTRLPVFYHHGMDAVFKARPIGEGELKADDVGLWLEAQLELRDEYERALYALAQAGKLGWSSGAVGHLVEKEGAWIKTWPLGEASLTPTPAEPSNTAMPVKAWLDLQQARTEPIPAPEAEAPPQTAELAAVTDDAPEAADETKAAPTDVSQPPETTMSDQKTDGAAQNSAPFDQDAFLDAMMKRMEDRVEAKAAEKAAAEKAYEKKPDVPYEANTAPVVSKFAPLWKFDNTADEDLAFACWGADGVQRSTGRRFSGDMLKSLALRTIDRKDSGHKARLINEMTKAGMPIKADEVMQSTLASYGDEWVGTAYWNEVWPRILQAAPVVARMPTVEVPQGSESLTIPVQSTPPTFYTVAQASAQDSNTLGKVTYTATSSQQTTAQQVLSVGKIGARTLWTGELEEDSWVAFANELRMSIEAEAAEVLESCVIDGDASTATNTNINRDAAAATGKQFYTVFDGMRHLALIDNSGNSRSGGTLTVEDFIETVKLMGSSGADGLDMNQCAFILDLPTNWKAITLDEFKSRDVYGNPTIEEGRLARVFGYPVIVSANMHRASTTRKAGTNGWVHKTAGSNTTGSFLFTRFDQWRLGYKRRLTFEVTRIPQADAYDMVALMRIGLIERGTEACTITYNVTV